MVTVARGLGGSAVLLLATLAVLDAGAGLSATGWLAGLACGAGTAAAVARSHPVALGPADLVTLARLALACAVAGLVAESLAGEPRTAAPAGLVGLVVLAALALALDAVDGRVARRTGTTSRFGARLDGEVDAFLLLVLSVQVAVTVTAWAIAVGAARYTFGAAGLAWPWLRAALPFRWWRKVVTAVQGVVLLLLVPGVLPLPVAYVALLVALALLAESFGRDVLWLWRHRAPPRDTPRRARPRPGHRERS